MHITQVTLTLPGGIRLELLSLYRPLHKAPTLPPTPPSVEIETTGVEQDSVEPIGPMTLRQDRILNDNVIQLPLRRVG